MVDLMDEVAEEVREERLIKAAKTYGPYIISAIVAILAITGGYIGWNAYQSSENKKLSSQYFEAVNLKKEQAKERLSSFEALAEMDKAGYGTLSRFKVAQIQEEFNPTKVKDIFIDIQAKSKAPDSVKYFAEFTAILNQFDQLDQASAQKLLTRLDEIQKNAPAWDFIAKFLQAQILMYTHQDEEAKNLFTLLSTAPEVPEDISTLASAYLSAYESQTTYTPTSSSS